MRKHFLILMLMALFAGRGGLLPKTFSLEWFSVLNLNFLTAVPPTQDLKCSCDIC